jgi:hypothetical protein
MKKSLIALLWVTFLASGLFFATSCSGKEETVTLQVTVPESWDMGNEYDFGLLIGDWMDRNIENREYKTRMDLYSYKTDLLHPRASPYQNQINGWLQEFNALQYSNVDGKGGVAAYKVYGNNFLPFTKYLVGSNQGGSWDEYQFAWFSGSSGMGETNDKVAPSVVSGAYSLVFAPGVYGLPLCPGEPGVSYQDCNKCNSTIETSRMNVRLLGEEWVISKVVPPTGATPVSDGEVFTEDGTEITLSKEAVYGILNERKCLTYESMGVKVCLDDVDSASGPSSCNPAIVSFTDLQGNLINDSGGSPVRVQILPGDTEKIYVPGYGDILVHCYRTYYDEWANDPNNPTHVVDKSWAELAVYSKQIKLTHNAPFNDQDSAWNALLGWTAGNDGTAAEAAYIKEIVLYNPEPLEHMSEGEVYTLIDLPAYAKYGLVYNGLENADYDHVEVRSRHAYSQTFQISGSGGTSPACNPGETLQLSPAQLMVVESENDGFTYEDMYVSKFYVIGIGSDGYGCSGSPKPGDVILEDRNGRYFYIGYPSDQAVGNTNLEYLYAGGEGSVVVYGPGESANGSVEVWLSEDIGPWDGSPGQTCKLVDAVGVKDDPNNEQLLSVFTGRTDAVGYIIAEDGKDPVGTDLSLIGPSDILDWHGHSDYSTDFITLRGSYAKSSGRKRIIDVADRIRHAKFSFGEYSPLGSEHPSPYVFVCDKIPEGGTCTIGDVSIFVMSIDQFFKSCGFDPEEIKSEQKETKPPSNQTTKIKVGENEYEIPSQITIKKN